ncbi:uncharacterized protein A1O9_09408 [Exophiala aquamarina CBS 119918]|uniref:Glycosyl transferase n=1 Tax=Exophiala aquamarina CBS 119918 TaxID=1182545 RepID=A0A072P3G8_9EURO|nr:uncharacterized protein A1O9_09408 [Exophiala aquamarina CBS 119918]KEF54242.1 hypothetical protein A1O9_09408 [Exophiala aquamarina CBS 119918]
MDSDKLSPMILRIRPRASHKIVGIGVVVVALLYIATQFSGYQISTSNLLAATTTAASAVASSPETAAGTRVDAEFEPIPNIVHYVWLLNPKKDNTRLEFKHFLSLYAASIYWNPDKIYIHTDIPEGGFLPEPAAETPRDQWNLLIANRPNVEINHVTAPAMVPGRNRTITGIEHKSDFLRLQMMRRYGGVYLDWDAHPLRDIKPLRYSGFKAIVGREPSSRIQTGTYMATKDSILMETWSEKMSLAYDGTWTHHSNTLLTYLAPRTVPQPGEVLIMEQDAFTPGDFTTLSYNRFYDIHPESPIQDLSDSWEGLFDRFDEPQRWPKWHINYSATYVLHVFGLQRAHKDLKLNGFTELTPEYVLARQSNAARALYPTARRMVEERLIMDPFAE